VTFRRIVVAAGAPIVRGLSEPSAAAKKSAGKNAVAAPLFDGIVPVVAWVPVVGDVTLSLVAGLGVVVALVVAVPDVVVLVDDEPHPASGRIAARVASTAAVAERLIDEPPAADKSSRGFEMRPVGTRRPARLFEYDAHRRRRWIHGQRCHHGAGGTLVALTAVLGLLAAQAPRERQDPDSKPLLALVLAGGALMAHDWKDHSIWFQRGRGPRR
jgi:hypothetical protein